jgi:hypothetical protein
MGFHRERDAEKRPFFVLRDAIFLLSNLLIKNYSALIIIIFLAIDFPIRYFFTCGVNLVSSS